MIQLNLQPLSPYGDQAASKSQPSDLMVGLSDDQPSSWVISAPSVNLDVIQGITKTLLLEKFQSFSISPQGTRNEGQSNSLLE